MSGFKYVGKRVPRVDAEDKVRGKTIFSTDFKLSNMLVGKVLRSPHAHARILRIDTTKARELSGVEAVVTYKDIPYNNNYSNALKDAQLLASDRVRFIGDEVALVAAVTEEIAESALRLIEVEYDPMQCVTRLSEAIDSDNVLIHEDKPKNIAITYDISRNDIDEAFEKADVIVSDKFTFPTLHHAYMEPNCAIAWYHGGNLTVYCASQVYFRVRQEIKKIFGLDEANIVIKALETGGAFGARNEQKTPLLAAALALKTAKPVRILNTREEEFVATRPAVAMEIEVAIAADKQGNFLGKKTTVLSDNGAYSSCGPWVLSVAVTRADNMYNFKSVKTIGHSVYTNKPPTTAYRGYGNPQMHFAVESLIDELAEKLRIDPFELRLKNFIKKNQTGIQGYKITSCGLPECAKKAMELTDWSRKRKTKVEGKGIGVAALIHATGSRAGEPEFSGGSAVVKVDSAGRISVYVGEAEIGQGSRTVFAQIAAEELQNDPKQICVILGDTDLTPFSTGTHGSKLSTVLGKAVMLAARNVKDQMIVFSKKLIGEGNVALKEGKFVNIDNGKSVSFAEVAKLGSEARSGLPFFGLGNYEPDCPMPDSTGYGNPASAYQFGIQIAEVTVGDNGKIKVDRLVSVHDVGKAINPQMVEGQIEGGVLQGIGMTMMEKLVTNDDGEIMNGSYMEYKVPTIFEAPEIVPGIVETIDPNGPYGAKGVGEPPIISVAAAVSNAIYNAVGIRITEIPVDPAVLARVKKKGS
ncbi:MAG: xanthine dehydrogenase family protein molybdopterin-binding subunit [Tepidanaerobacteraceae bacterium]|jgi:CO/xanthine dehydrogenase Mo-binding subunit